MSSIKIKFHNKPKRQYNNKLDSSLSHFPIHGYQMIDFLLRQNKDTQKAKNQLREFSQQIYENYENQNKIFSWSNQKISMTKAQLNNKAYSKDKDGNIRNFKNGTEEKLLKNTKYNHSYGNLNPKQQLIALKKQQNMQVDNLENKAYFLTSINQKQKQDIKSNSQNFKKQQKLIQTRISIQNDEKYKLYDRNDHKKNIQSNNQLKNCSKIIVQQHSKEKKQIFEKKRSKGMSTLCFKAPQINQNNINFDMKRSITLQSQANLSQANIKKANFYFKKTKTICVLQKPAGQTNKCISLSRYHSTIHANKNRIISSNQNQKIVKKLQRKIENLQIIEKSNERINNIKTKNQQNSKANQLRQQFQRLRKLLKKQQKSEFEVDKDLPLKIFKF